MIKVARGCLGAEELEAIGRVFAGGYFGQGKQVAEFEEALRCYVGAEHVVATNTGTSALHLALDALGIGPGDEVIVPSLTFAASFQAIHACGATPVPCDVEPATLSMDLADAERRITPATRALMPVHYAGNPCDIDALLDIGRRRQIRIVEDAAHAFGSTYKGRRIGSVGDIVCFSFDSIKNITCGEGGAVVCGSAELAERMRQKRLLGMQLQQAAQRSGADNKRGQLQVIARGFRYHMSNINAAIGVEQLKKADGMIARRRAICRRYDRAFAELPGLRTLPIDYDETAPHIYVVRVGQGLRDALAGLLQVKEIETGINYRPNHLQPYFRQEGLQLPAAEEAYREILTLPLHCGLSDAEVECVIGSVQGFFQKQREVDLS